jgi:hypothetical protein
MGILFLIYTCLSVYSASIGETENTSENNEGIFETEMSTDRPQESVVTVPSEKVCSKIINYRSGKTTSLPI